MECNIVGVERHIVVVADGNDGVDAIVEVAPETGGGVFCPDADRIWGVPDDNHRTVDDVSQEALHGCPPGWFSGVVDQQAVGLTDSTEVVRDQLVGRGSASGS